MITKNPLTTLLSTSEGLAFLAFLAMTIYGMLTGEISYMEGLASLGGGAGVWTVSRSFVKKDDPDDTKAMLLEAIDRAMEKERADA